MVPAIYTKPPNVEFLKALSQNGSPFLIVGGAAVGLHGCRNLLEIDDLDIMVEASLENADCINAALARCGYRTLTREQLSKPRRLIPLRIGLWLDILTVGSDLLGLLARSIPAKINELDVRVVGIDDLIEMKKKAAEESENKAKHQRDLDCLMQIQMNRKPSGRCVS